MVKKHREPSPPPLEHIYWGADVPMRVIRRFARVVAERFDPDRIILFGSHAYGNPRQDSDVDILVIMPARNRHSQAVRIRWEVPAPFPMDLFVYRPETLRKWLEWEDPYLMDILDKGIVLYEAGDASLGA